ncbi:MAG: 50S ribosomal protein L21 [bacterium]|nr:50S ribosomal protein L21 [bacterium]
MSAVIKTGGKQYIVKPGQKLKIEKLLKEAGDEVVFDEVLLLQKDEQTEIGTPFLKGVTVKAKVISQGKGKKIDIIKYKPKVRYHKKTGHRQRFTEVEIISI